MLDKSFTTDKRFPLIYVFANDLSSTLNWFVCKLAHDESSRVQEMIRTSNPRACSPRGVRYSTLVSRASPAALASNELAMSRLSLEQATRAQKHFCRRVKNNRF
jgi:hypothetical protein